MSLDELPPELFLKISIDVLAAQGNLKNVLLLSKRISNLVEALSMRRSPNFHSQSAFFGWLNGSCRIKLNKVKEVTVHVHDVDFRSLLDSDELYNQAYASPQLLTGNLYDTGLINFKRAFEKTQNVNVLNIHALQGQQTDLYRAFLSRLLEGLSSMCPNLECLCLEGIGYNQNLAFLKDLRLLRSFSFDGFSSMSPIETACILARLTDLRDLSIVSQPDIGSPSPHHPSESMDKLESRSHISNNATKLISLSVIERVIPYGTTCIFTPDILDSLLNLESLTTISISLGRTPDDIILSSLQGFLVKSAIKELELDWPEFEFGVLEKYDMIQEELEELGVRARSAMDALGILCFIYECRKKSSLRGLQRVVLIRTAVDYGDALGRVWREDSGIEDAQSDIRADNPAVDATDEDNVYRTKRLLGALGVQVGWHTEHP